MSMPFYVAPEQVMKDRADYARKGIARGRGLVAVVSVEGIVVVAENPSTTLRKVSEIYDRIAFAGVAQFPARVKCALLSWMAFKDALTQAQAAREEKDNA